MAKIDNETLSSGKWNRERSFKENEASQSRSWRLQISVEQLDDK